MSAYRECPTVPAMASISEAQYREAIASGMTVSSLDDPRYAEQRRDTQKRIRASEGGAMSDVPISVLIAEARRLEAEHDAMSDDYPVTKMILSARAALAWCAVRRARDSQSPVRISLKEVR